MWGVMFRLLALVVVEKKEVTFSAFVYWKELDIIWNTTLFCINPYVFPIVNTILNTSQLGIMGSIVQLQIWCSIC